jgi:hypothetical protein
LPEVSGGASAPPRLRDARGRFVARTTSSDSALLAEFKRKGIVQFRDPFHSVGVFTMKKQKSMKGLPVALYHSDFEVGGAWHCCTGDWSGYGSLSQYGAQLAISPRKHYGWPGDKWEGKWTVQGMASLLIHLARSVDLRRIDCLETIASHPE